MIPFHKDNIYRNHSPQTNVLRDRFQQTTIAVIILCIVYGRKTEINIIQITISNESIGTILKQKITFCSCCFNRVFNVRNTNFLKTVETLLSYKTVVFFTNSYTYLYINYNIIIYIINICMYNISHLQNICVTT